MRKSNYSNYFESLSSMNKTFKFLGDPSGSSKEKILEFEFHKSVKNYGIRTTVVLFKAFYNEATRFALDLPVEILTPIWLKRNKVTKLPLFINKHFGKDLKGSIDKRRLALSFLRCYESVTLPPIADLESVIRPSTGNTHFRSIEPDFEYFLNNSRFASKVKEDLNKTLGDLQTKNKVEGASLHFSGKSGISGKSILTASTQSKRITGEVKENLIAMNEIFCKDHFKHILNKNSEISDEISKRLNAKPFDIDLLTRYLGRITFVSDKGGKTRLVAIGNYWVQETFNNVHELVYSVLRGLREDGTYKQEDSFDAVLKASSRSPVWSFDLSKATDRFPLGPQCKVLSFCHNEIGTLWDKILKDLNFFYEGKEYFYKVGQPMGILSSWAVFALTHHFIIQYCAFKEGHKSFNKYRILGDDVALWDSRVAKRYKELILNLDIEISESKSIQPSWDSSGPACAEFAKRLSWYGHEMTPVSPEQSRASWKRLSDFPLFITWLKQRGYGLDRSPVSQIFKIGKFSIYQQRLLVVLFFFWGLMRDPVMDLTQYMTFELEGSASGLRFQRINRLEELQDNIDDEIYDIRGDVRKSLELDVPDELAFVRALRTRIEETRRFLDKLFETPLEFGEMADAFSFSGGRQLSLSELEFLPEVDVNSILKGLHQRGTKQQQLSSYLKQLAKNALKEINFENELH